MNYSKNNNMRSINKEEWAHGLPILWTLPSSELEEETASIILALRTMAEEDPVQVFKLPSIATHSVNSANIEWSSYLLIPPCPAQLL